MIITYHTISLDGFKNGSNNGAYDFKLSMYEIYELWNNINKIFRVGFFKWWQANQESYFNRFKNKSLTTLFYVIFPEVFQQWINDTMYTKNYQYNFYCDNGHIKYIVLINSRHINLPLGVLLSFQKLIN